MKEYLLLLAYGRKEILDECKYALLRLLNAYRDNPGAMPELILYTDDPGYFSDLVPALSCHLVPVDEEKIRHWQGEIGFVHRLKIEVIRDALKRFPGKVLYCDTDTCCLKPLSGLYAMIGEQEVLLHLSEGIIQESPNLHLKKWKKFLGSKSARAILGEEAVKTEMWNAGAIGLTDVHLPLLDEVLRVTDELYSLFPKHTVEQFAFCYVLAGHGQQIRPAEAYIFHYWNLKEFRSLLARFFKHYEGKGIARMVACSTDIAPESILPFKLRYQRLPSLWRKIRKWRGKIWQINAHVQAFRE